MSERVLQEQVYGLAAALNNLGRQFEQVAEAVNLMHLRIRNLEEGKGPLDFDEAIKQLEQAKQEEVVGS